VRQAERRVVETALARCILPRAEIDTRDQAERHRAMGVRHFRIGWDVAILARFRDAAGAAMRGLADAGAAPEAGYR